MDTLSSRFGTFVNGVITGFDRIVFKGMIRPIMHASGMESFLAARKVLNKDFKSYAMAQPQAIVQSVRGDCQRAARAGGNVRPVA
ncbi:MAG: hypothetical protein FWG42_10710 [Clostridiales bacterium]|nr:hypothetical protein [Clostridiales bacterium]